MFKNIKLLSTSTLSTVSPHQALERTVLLPALSATHRPSRPISWSSMGAHPCHRHQLDGLLLQHSWTHKCCSPSSFTINHKRCSTLDRQETEVRSHHRQFLQWATLATSPVQGIPTRYAFLSTSVCMVHHRSMLTGRNKPCSQQSRVCYQQRRHILADKPGTLQPAQLWHHRTKNLEPDLDNFCRSLKNHVI